MDDIEVLEVSCPLVDGSKLPFYDMHADIDSFELIFLDFVFRSELC